MSDRANPPSEPAPLYCCGIDWHRRKAALHVIDNNNKCVLKTTVLADVGRVALALEPFCPNVVAGVEATTGADDLADALDAIGIRCAVGDPTKIAILASGRPKSDGHDAEFLAALLADGRFPTLYRLPPAVRELREWLRERASLVEDRQGIRARRTLRGPRRRGLAGGEGGQTGNESHLVSAAEAGLTADIDRLEQWAVPAAERLFAQIFPRLTAVPGIGPLTAAVLCAEIGTIERFRRADNLLSYARLVVPGEWSGGRRVGGTNRHAGNSHLREAFLQAAHHLVQHYPPARAWVERRFPSDTQRGVGLMAVARRLVAAVYQMWRKGEDYDPARAFPPPVEGGRAM